MTFLRKNIGPKPEGKRLAFAGNALPRCFAIPGEQFVFSDAVHHLFGDFVRIHAGTNKGLQLLPALR